MNADQDRRLLDTFRQIEVAYELYAIVLRIFDVVPDDDLMIPG